MTRLAVSWSRFGLLLLLSLFVVVPPRITAQASAGVLDQLSDSLKRLSDQVSPAVVEIRASRYGEPKDKDDDDDPNATMVIKQRVTGSGVILSPDGYIVTNAHVIENAKNIRVFLNHLRPSGMAARDFASVSGKFYQAALVGIDDDIDIAVLKIKATGLPTMSLADYEKVKQGEVVVAIGSPLGAHNAITMGVVSSVARQMDSDSRAVYIQTDAALNPGNSGGPLVDTEGRLVGLNTMIVEGERVGLAIPSDIVKYAFDQIRSRGRIRYGDIGLDVQDITPLMAAGLRLSRDEGVIVADVVEGGSAQKANIRPGDVVVGVDGTTINRFVEFVARLYQKQPGSTITLQLLRGHGSFSTILPVTERRGQPEIAEKGAKSERNLIARLGVYAADIKVETGDAMPLLRQPWGVLVTGKSMTEEGSESQSELEVGDVIHSMNGVPVKSAVELRSSAAKLHPGDAIVLHVERKRKLLFVSFQAE